MTFNRFFCVRGEAGSLIVADILQAAAVIKADVEITTH